MATTMSSISLRIFLPASLLVLCLLCSFKKSHAHEARRTTASHHFHHRHIVQISSLLPATVCKPSTKGTQSGRASLQVVHKHGPCSSFFFYKANAPNLTHTLLQDQARVNSIKPSLSNSGQETQNDKIPAIPEPSASSYVAVFGLGTPPKQSALIIDTGSDLTWTQCKPCQNCYPQRDPIFDPAESSTYAKIKCGPKACTYNIDYGDNSHSNGFVATENLTITLAEVLNDFKFGCGFNNYGHFGFAAGMFGLGRGEVSFVSQSEKIYHKLFSYCLPTKSSTGYLAFGAAAIPRPLKFTPLFANPQDPSLYFINMIGIRVGGINIAAGFPSATAIDSGTAITRLPSNAYNAMRDVFREKMKKYPLTSPIPPFDTCYDLRNYPSVIVPLVSLFFSGGVEVKLDSVGILSAPVDRSQVCFAFAAKSNGQQFPIFGNFQQQKFDVSYDINGGRIGFGAGGCN